jgi:hypothetical protein
MTQSPMWRRGVEALDAKAGGHLEGVVRSENFAVAVGLGLRIRREVSGRITRASSAALHALNLPAKADLDRLMRHVASLEREVLALGDPAPFPRTGKRA